jgi:tetratricopeptide (TPR) repeat protein
MSVQLDQAVEAFRSGDLDRARMLAEAAVSATRSATAHHLLGLVRCRLGEPGAGIEHLRIAAEAEPQNPAFNIMLMRALVDAGRAAEVLQMDELPPIRSAAVLEQWRARGEAADAAQDPAAAVIAWSNVTAAAPRDWRGWANLGGGLIAQSRWTEAIEALRSAVSLNPTDASLRWSLSSALAATDRHEEALPQLDKFDELGGRTGASILARGRCLHALGCFEEAERAYREALKLSPNDPEVFRELGMLLERMNSLDMLVQLVADAAAAGVPEERLAHVHVLRAYREHRYEEAYALLETFNPDEDRPGWFRLKAKIADRLGKSAEAFAAADAMNRLTRDFDSWRAKGASYRGRLLNLARSLTETSVLPQLEKPERRMPAFLVGFPRSGTTLLDTILMGHPQTAVLEEVHLLGAAERQIGKVVDLPRTSRALLERARNAYLAELALHVEPSFEGVVVDKLPLNMLGAPFIQAMFPGAPIIFAQRHPCDAVLSGFMQPFIMNDAMACFLTIEDAADLYDAVLSGWRAMCENFDFPVHTVRYESLVEDPVAELRPLVDFLGLDWDERLLAHTETAKQRGAIITPSYDQVTEPLSSRSVGRWKRYREQLKSVLPVLLPWAERLGYRE